MALTAKELRMGNYVLDRGDKIIRIDWWETLNKACMDMNINGQKVHPLTENVEYCQPIPLTEQWLLDFGFIKDGNGHWWKNLVTHYLELIEMNKWFFPVFVELPELSNEQEQRVGLPRIGSVHEMQNLFFALTGEELTIKGDAPNSL